MSYVVGYDRYGRLSKSRPMSDVTGEVIKRLSGGDETKAKCQSAVSGRREVGRPTKIDRSAFLLACVRTIVLVREEDCVAGKIK